MPTTSDRSSTETLYRLIYACQRGQRVAIVGSHSDENTLREELYVEQDEDEYVRDFFRDEYEEDGRLLILTGSAGDGKSALLARGYDPGKTDLPEGRVNMDATAARRRDGDYADRLTSFFDSIIDEVERGSGHRSAVAINYGLAVDYFERREAPDRFAPIWGVMQDSQTKLRHEPPDQNISVINLSHRSTYDQHPDRLGSGLVRELFDRFDPTREQSPFHNAYEYERDNCPAGEDCLLQYNARQLANPDLKDQLSRLLAGWSVATGSYLNPRTIIDSIASMLVPTGLQDLSPHEVCPVGAAIEEGTIETTGEELVWNAAFRAIDTERDAQASPVDPASYTSFETDQSALKWGTNTDALNEALQPLPAVGFQSRVEKVRTLLRKRYLVHRDGGTILDDDTFDQFLAALTLFNSEGDPEELQERARKFLSTTRTALSSWTGQKRDDNLVEFVDGQRSTDYRYLSHWTKPEFNTDASTRKTKELAVPGRIKLIAGSPDGGNSDVPIPLSFSTYRLMTQISQGYTPNATDLNQSHAIRMLHSRLDDFTDKREYVKIERRSGNREVTIQQDDFGFSISSEGIE